MVRYDATDISELRKRKTRNLNDFGICYDRNPTTGKLEIITPRKNLREIDDENIF